MWSSLHPHERAARVIRIVGWIALSLSLASAFAVFLPAAGQAQPVSLAIWGVAILMVGIPASLLVIARGLLAHRNWARTGAIIYGVLMLTGFPIGTAIGAYVLWQLRKGWPVDSPAYASPWT